MPYFNYRFLPTNSRWERRAFAHDWWRILASDKRWVPPYYPQLRGSLNPAQNEHLARLRPEYVRIEALPRRQDGNRDDADQDGFVPGSLETTVAAGLILRDERRHDGKAYLSLPHVVNDEESLGRLLDHVTEMLAMSGCSRLIAPTGLSPHLGSGWLLDHWDLLPPVHTPYNPPYLLELVDRFMQPLGNRHYLYHVPVPGATPPLANAPAEVVPLEPTRLAGELRPLLAAACENEYGFVPPDSTEATFILRWLGIAPLAGWLAQVDGRPVGFALVQPDLAPLLHRTRGGRGWLWRSWFTLAKGWRTHRGRLLLGAVLPEYRRQGIGQQLLQWVLTTAGTHTWEQVSVGPLLEESAAALLLQGLGAQPRQTYQLYEKIL